MRTLFKLAIRDLLRNPRRSFFSSLALGGGLALLLLMSSILVGDVRDSLKQTILLQSGHFQVQAKDYNADKNSLIWADMVENPDEVAAKIAALPNVTAATPRLYASGMLVTSDKSYGVQINGIDPASSANDPYRDGLLTGEFLLADDRDSVLLGKLLADRLNLHAGDDVDLLINTANGELSEQRYKVKGIFTTNTPAYDRVTIFMPLAKAQAVTQTEKHASTIFVLLTDRELTNAVTAALKTEKYKIVTWQDASKMTQELEKMSQDYMGILYFIVLAITATVIVNTLVMAVFERTREIGILSAIGLKSRQIMGMFLIESAILALGGILLGLILGGLLVLYANRVGFYIGDFGMTGFMLRNRLYGYLTFDNVTRLSMLALIITLIASLYPALMAAHMQPVEALRGGK